jgi:hypothetical protein
MKNYITKIRIVLIGCLILLINHSISDDKGYPLIFAPFSGVGAKKEAESCEVCTLTPI